jgi:dipeptidyl-peptidase 4
MSDESRISRRSFLKDSTLAGAGAAVLGNLAAPSRAGASPVVAEEQAAGQADAAQAFNLDEWLHELFGTEEISAKRFGVTRWVAGGKSYMTLEPVHEKSKVKEIVSYDTASGARHVAVSADQLKPSGATAAIEVESFEWSKDMKHALLYTNSKRVWRENTRGDYWVWDADAKSLRKLGGNVPESTLMFAKFSPDGSKAAYVHDRNLYVEDVSVGAITPLTHDESETLINGTSDWVYEEELDVRDGFRWSHDGASIAFWHFDSSPVREYALINNLGGEFRDPVTHIPYPEVGPYPKIFKYRWPGVGTPNSLVKIGVVGADGGPIRWMEVPGDPADHYIPYMEWAGDSNELLLQHMNRRQNINDVLLADARTGAVRRVWREEDKAWVNKVPDVEWVQKGKAFLWPSDRTGWQHIYLISRDGVQVRQVTRGNFDVMGVAAVDPQDEWLYFYASPGNATQRYLFRTRLDGRGSHERLSPANAAGSHDYNISPDCHWAIHIYSAFSKPPLTDLVALPNHGTKRVLAENGPLRSRIAPLLDARADFFQVKVEGGATLDGWMIKPSDFDPTRKYPILMNVYGGPAAQTVLDVWRGKMGLFHRALANAGYLIASVDNRGTPAPKGRAWRKAIVNSIGPLVTKDQTAAVKGMGEMYPYIDLSRVAVWGWSGGGSSTLNLMFRSPDVFHVGMAVAPVVDERLYDTIYFERYMGLPQDNPKVYEEGSAINFAQGLRGKLLLVHGSGDDNVHFANSQLLVDRLIELGKPFDFMQYPNRTHAIMEGKGTRLHLFSLLARFLKANLPAGAV